jgi:hypothetical protein
MPVHFSSAANQCRTALYHAEDISHGVTGRWQRQLLPLLARHGLRIGEIAHVHHVGFEHLPDGAPRVAVDDGRRQRPKLQAGKAVRNESELSQLQVKFTERRLSPVKRDKRNLGLNNDRIGKHALAVPDGREFRALDIDLQEQGRNAFSPSYQLQLSGIGSWQAYAGVVVTAVKLAVAANANNAKMIRVRINSSC